MIEKNRATHSSSDDAVQELDADKCWELLGAADFGRLVVATDESVDIFPMNYLVKDRTIYLRSSPGAKLVDITKRPSIAFEVDGIDHRRRWSVVVKGDARRLGLASEIEESGVLELWSQNPTKKWNYVRISPESVTGRSFKSRPRPH